MKAQSRSIDSGIWGDKISWELYPANDLKDVPALELCTAVFCLAITEDEKILLMRAARGWSILGGHIEEGESIPDTLMRESLEEGGLLPGKSASVCLQKNTLYRANPASESRQILSTSGRLQCILLGNDQPPIGITDRDGRPGIESI